jgi:hypothetical protein
VATATLAITAAAAAGTYAVATAGGFTTPRPAPVAAGQPSSSPSPAPAGQAGTSSSPAASPSASASTAPPIAPTPISLPAAVARQLGVVTTPVKTTTDVSATGVAPEIATVFTAHGFELHDEQFGFRPGFDPSAESSWPAGVPGAFQWTFDFFPSGADASAVQEVAAAHLVAAGFTPMTVPGLSDVGVTVRTRTTGDATTQVWSYVNRNVLIQMAVNGRGLDGASALARQLFTALGGP